MSAAVEGNPPPAVRQRGRMGSGPREVAVPAGARINEGDLPVILELA